MGGGHGGHGTTYKGMTLHAPKRWHSVTGKGMCAIMWSEVSNSDLLSCDTWVHIMIEFCKYEADWFLIVDA
uniref:Uncharacterized protein n=1 Tax=Chenopodium quinoa TaxID=63459 RepID=A0A803LRS9_CHEQI